MRPLQRGSRSRHHALIFRGITPDFSSSRHHAAFSSITPSRPFSHNHTITPKKKASQAITPSPGAITPSHRNFWAHHADQVIRPSRDSFRSITPSPPSNPIVSSSRHHTAFTLITQSGPFIRNPLGDSPQGRLVLSKMYILLDQY